MIFETIEKINKQGWLVTFGQLSDLSWLCHARHPGGHKEWCEGPTLVEALDALALNVEAPRTANGGRIEIEVAYGKSPGIGPKSRLARMLEESGL